jgi:hypothetical protein
METTATGIPLACHASAADLSTRSGGHPSSPDRVFVRWIGPPGAEQPLRPVAGSRGCSRGSALQPYLLSCLPVVNGPHVTRSGENRGVARRVRKGGRPQPELAFPKIPAHPHPHIRQPDHTRRKWIGCLEHPLVLERTCMSTEGLRFATPCETAPAEARGRSLHRVGPDGRSAVADGPIFLTATGQGTGTFNRVMDSSTTSTSGDSVPG